MKNYILLLLLSNIFLYSFGVPRKTHSYLNNNEIIAIKDSLLKAIKNKDFNTIKKLVIHNPHCVNYKISSSKNSPLHLACMYNCPTKIINFLIQRNAQVNARNNYNDTPLHTLAYSKINRHTRKSVLVLLNNGADIDAYGFANKTALHLAISCAYTNSCQYSINSFVQLLLNHNANPNTQDSQSNTPLHDAALYNFSTITTTLLRNNADPYIKNNYNEQAFDAIIDNNSYCDILKNYKNAYTNITSECSICLEQIHPQNFTCLECNHIYHTTCIQKWLEHIRNEELLYDMQLSCPLCRQYPVINSITHHQWIMNQYNKN